MREIDDLIASLRRAQVKIAARQYKKVNEAEEKLAKLGAMVFEAYLYDDTITVDVCGRISKYVDAAGLGDSFDEQGRLKNSVKETIEELNRE